jgi:aconitate hydratase
VKTSLAPGSKVVTDYLLKAGLTQYLDALGFNLVGYGCTTCIGNSGPLPDDVAEKVDSDKLIVAAVLSGNRNFEGRIHPQVQANYIASPPLVVAYAIAGCMDIDLTTEPLGKDKSGANVFLKDLWPTNAEIDAAMANAVTGDLFRKQYADVFAGDARWQAMPTPTGERFTWDPKSEYIKKPPYFDGMPKEPKPLADITGARALAVLGDSVTTDHISPAGNISRTSPAAKYLLAHGVAIDDFNSYGARRGNHEVMVRGTFANTRLRNMLVPGIEGGVTRYLPTGEQMSIFDASEKYRATGTPLIILAGQEYGSGSSRDWAAKGPMLLGVRAAIAESFERIHRSNLIGMGILPLEFSAGETRESLGLTGEETFAISGIAAGLRPRMSVVVTATASDGKVTSFTAVVRIDTPDEADYYRHGGILQFVLRQLAK